MSNIRFINRSDIQNCLTMSDAISAMAKAMEAVSQGRTVTPARQITALPDQIGFLGLMPGTASAPDILGVKLVTLYPGNPSQGLPSIQGVICLFDYQNGSPIAVLDAAEITAIRTAATSAMATALLARKDAVTHTIVGTGVQAEMHARAIVEAKPTIQKTQIWGRDRAKASALAQQLNSQLSCDVVDVRDLQTAVKSDIVSMVTSATEPVLSGRWLNPGCHINLVGPHHADQREADTETILRSSVYVDVLENAKREAGDLIIPVSEQAFSFDDVVAEIGQVVSDPALGRKSDEEITLFKSLGVATQDLFAATVAFERAAQDQIGTELEA